MCTKEYIFHFFATISLALCCAEILLAEMVMPSSLVVKQNFLNANIIVNYHSLIICNLSGYCYINFHSN